jgi:hypothetical protein
MLAILARMLAFVACMPLLLPSGFCLCDAERGCPTASSHGASDSESPGHDCAHDLHRHDDFSAPANHSPSHHEPDEHAPGCPAAVASMERVQTNETAIDLSLNLLNFEWSSFDPAAEPRCADAVPYFADPWPDSPPLYLFHCSLVI